MRKSILYILVLLLGVFVVTACEYEFVEQEEIVVPTPDPDNPLSFADDIVPIFTNGNYCTACHDTGGEEPNLEAASAYNSLTNGGYINTTNPEQSTLITVAGPGTSEHGWKKFTNSQTEKILQWISEGASNN